MARRRKDDTGERRTQRLGVRLTPTEKAELVRRAEPIKVTDYCRIVLLSDAKKPAPSARDPHRISELALEIRRVGMTVNQLAHTANATNELPEASTLHEAMAQIIVVLDKVKAL
jgi:hypothetical protein